jgi:hypothetical protein
MTTAAVEAPAAGRPPAKSRRSRKPDVFRITFTAGDQAYRVVPLAPDPEVASCAYRLVKVDGSAVYDCHVPPGGLPVCDCPGAIKHGLTKSGRGCRHVRMLRAAGMIPAFSAAPNRDAAEGT